MKILFFAVAFLLGNAVSAQEGTEKAGMFVRIFDSQGKKIGKGKILFISDTSLQLKGKRESPIPVNNIGQIKTKHSGGRNVLIGAITGATIFGIFGAVTTEADETPWSTEAEGAAVGAVFGGATGAAVGGITILFKNSKTYEIKGDKLKFNEFKEAVTGLK